MSYGRLSLEAKNETFAGIMSNGKRYSVPRFQRDYSWSDEQWNELWQDIQSMREQKQQHFMGYLVLRSGVSEDGNHYSIIDGQQRITTITILIMAALGRFRQLIEEGRDAKDDEKRYKNYEEIYLGVFDAVSVRTRPKIILNRHNKEHFQQIIDNGYQVPRVRGITATNRYLNKALNFFQKKLSGFQGKELAEFINSVVENLVFTSITTNDDINAYVVFETLNARGVHLSAPDLLKNHLLSVMSGDGKFGEPHFKDFEDQWAHIIEQLGESQFTAFLCSYHGMTGKPLRKKDIYRDLKAKIANGAEGVMPYLKGIKKYAPLYAALQNPEDSFWQEYGEGQYSDCRLHLRTLHTFQIKTPQVLLMAAYFKFEASDFVKLMQWISVISIRYNVICQKIPNEQERMYSHLASRIISGEIGNTRDLANSLRGVYPDDEEFTIAFANKSIPGRRSPKKILRLITAIEKHISGGDEPPISITLEHVLPYNPDDAWQESFGRDDYSNAVDRLGNMALLTKSGNMGQEPFAEKRKKLAASSYAINRKIAEYPEWNMESLNEYQKWLAKQAKAVWQIPNLQ